MPPKSILILTDWYEPGYKAGGPIQSCRNFVAGMHGLYSISVLTSDRDLGETGPYPDIETNQWITRPPGIPVYYTAKESLKASLLANLIESQSPDFIYLNSMYSYRFSILPLILLYRNKIKSRIILAPRGMLQECALKFKPAKKKLFISLLNGLRIPSRIYFHATDPQEKRDILAQFPKAGRVDVIPNFSGELPSTSTPLKKTQGHLCCVYISRIIPKKNILFFLKLLNMVPENIQLEFTIYGEVEDDKYWRQALAVMHFLPKNTTVLYRGPIPHEKVIPSLAEHHVFVLPSKAENFGHAIFEAFSAGRPCLISDKTPWRGLKKDKIGWDLSLEDMGDWISAIREASDFDQQTFNTWSECCRQFAKLHQERSDLKNAYTKLFS